MARILIVEDDSILQSAYNTVLSMEGYQVDVASDGLEGLRVAKEKKPDLILLDMLMPNLGGLEFLKVFEAKNHPETKIIVFSNIVSPEDVRQAMDLGAVKYMTKANFTPKEMVATIKELLGQQSTGQAT
ncbi:MAG TPA: response regulator [Candidatus Dormibacteraeota bacterium]|nr:response regulator [Candidatus Dormibacteraeota bacterium]